MVELTAVSPPSESVRDQQANTRADLDGQDLGNGTLYIAESCVTWQRENDGLGLNIDYPTISCHAVSRDLQFFPHECLHLMIEHPEPFPDEEGREEGPTSMNLRFIPLDKSLLQQMYKSMAQCQALHPDPVEESAGNGEFDDLVEEDEEEEFYYNGDKGEAHLSSAGRSQLARFDAMLQFGGGGDASLGDNGAENEDCSDQFQDADME